MHVFVRADLNTTPYGTDESPYAFFKMSRDERGLQNDRGIFPNCKLKPADATAMAMAMVIIIEIEIFMSR